MVEYTKWGKIGMPRSLQLASLVLSVHYTKKRPRAYQDSTTFRGVNWWINIWRCSIYPSWAIPAMLQNLEQFFHGMKVRYLRWVKFCMIIKGSRSWMPSREERNDQGHGKIPVLSKTSHTSHKGRSNENNSFIFMNWIEVIKKILG